MENPFKSIYKFNREAGLLDKGYSDFLEPSFLIEEALEDFNTPWLAKVLHNGAFGNDTEVEEDMKKPKGLSRWIVSLAREQFDRDGNRLEDITITDLQRFDKHIDAIVYAVGGAYKLGLTPQQLEAGIAAVMHSNTKKIGAGKDEHGKALKPDNWPEIEAEQVKKLQAILDKRA